MLKVYSVRHTVHFLLPEDQDLEFSASPAPCLPACTLSCHDDNVINL